MQPLTKQTQSDLLNTQLSVDENQSKQQSSELLHREKINNTPFEVIGNEEYGYFIAFGKYKLTESFNLYDYNVDNIHDIAVLYLNEHMWNIMTNLMTLFAEFATVDTLNRIEKAKQQEAENSL